MSNVEKLLCLVLGTLIGVFAFGYLGLWILNTLMVPVGYSAAKAVALWAAIFWGILILHNTRGKAAPTINETIQTLNRML